MLLKYMTMAILVVASIKQVIRCSILQNSKEDDKFIYTLFITVTVFMTHLGVI